MELMKVNDLEEKILGVWSTSDDIDLLLDWISDHVLIYGADDDTSEDELMNLLHQSDALVGSCGRWILWSEGAVRRSCPVGA